MSYSDSKKEFLYMLFNLYINWRDFGEKKITLLGNMFRLRNLAIRRFIVYLSSLLS